MIPRRTRTSFPKRRSPPVLGWVGTDELEGLYAVASWLVFPSLLEGFRLSLLEAMVRGVPVACTGRGSLDAALVVDPLSEPQLAGAIERLLICPAEAARLRAAGQERAAGFSRKVTATGTLAADEPALG